MFAVQGGHLEVIKYLIGKGADVNVFDKDGCTPLVYAAHRGNLDIVRYLVDNSTGANMMMINCLRYAAQGGHLE